MYLIQVFLVICLVTYIYKYFYYIFLIHLLSIYLFVYLCQIDAQLVGKYVAIRSNLINASNEAAVIFCDKPSFITFSNVRFSSIPFEATHETRLPVSLRTYRGRLRV
ncbi:ORF39 [Leucania separata nucleopolyhedrovirus]|uniref:ORF39 n=1 Tax=Leucania separata nucleopolyhedrovirus TaxID=1307956 RepID=Q0IL80_NPVLS|nr:ORF39 [Leucania separata nucleopolyhedrovirus]AAR28803.1 ORF39 [Leucania separata nucleopolyhedrovirus]